MRLHYDHPGRGHISEMIREVPSHISIFETRFAVTGACISQSQRHSKPETRIDKRFAAVNCQLATLYIHRARQMREFLIDMPLRFASNIWKLSYPTAKVDQSALQIWPHWLLLAWVSTYVVVVGVSIRDAVLGKTGTMAIGPRRGVLSPFLYVLLRIHRW